MEIKLVKQYLEMVLDLEAKKLATKEMIDSIQAKKFQAEFESMEEFREDTVPANRVEKSHVFSIIGTLAGLFLGFSACSSAGSAYKSFEMGIITLPLFSVIGGFVGSLIDTAVNNGRESQENEAYRIRVQREREQLQSRNRKREERNEQKRQIANKQNQLIATSAQKLQATYDETERTLQRLYAQDIIHPKYRDIVALSYIYEYLDIGICTELEGIDGAYRQYETDVRLDKIISGLSAILSRLDTVVAKMDRILWKMDSMHQTFVAYAGESQKSSERLQETINHISGQIKTQSEQLNEIGVNTAVTAYTTKVIERNQYYERNWNNGRGLYDHVNMP